MRSSIVNDIVIYAPNSREELIDYAMNNKLILIAINAEKIIHANNKLKNLINRNVGYPDGIGAVIALKKKYKKNIIKIPGCELWLDIINNFYKSKSFYLIGGKKNIINETVKKLKINFSGIKICNYRDGYIQNELEEEKLIEDILMHQPDIIFVAMGSPKQEYLMQRIQAKHKALFQGLGGSFDVYTGNVARAPEWWINNNVEWAYRLLKQPFRLFRQVHLIKFYILLKLNKL
tara:strand:+ start:668 stop:1366 length:699 start_codon:yes stop_codon:yes gene_type:complete